MKGKHTPTALRKRRHERVRKTVTGTAERPRLAVYRSLNHIYAQVIDDTAGHTVIAASDQDADVRKESTSKKKSEVAGLVGDGAGQARQREGHFGRRLRPRRVPLPRARESAGRSSPQGRGHVLGTRGRYVEST